MKTSGYFIYDKNAVLKYILFSSIGIVAIINFITITTFPSWFDEAFFANVSFNLSQGQGFSHDLIPGYATGDILLYGPIYFTLQAGLIQLFGLHDWLFRLPNFVAGYITVALLFILLRQTGMRSQFLLLFSMALVVDVSFNRNLVFGRMDLLALMFVVLALFLTMNSRENSSMKVIGWWALIGAVSALAFLTSPRALFLLPVVFVVAVHSLFLKTEKPITTASWYAAFSAFMAFLIPVLIWAQYTGGLSDYISMFRGSESVQSHLGFSLFRSYFDNVAIIVFLLLGTLNFRMVLKNPLLLGLTITFVSFALFVKEVGPYAAMITPLLLAAIFLILSENRYKKNVSMLFAAVLILPGLLLILLRSADLITNADCRDGAAVAEMIHFKSGQTIVAPFKYYFLLENPDRNILTLQYARIKYNQILDQADYFISHQSPEHFTENSRFTEIHRFECKPRNIPLLPETFYNRSVYSERIYQRKTLPPTFTR